MKNKLKHNFGYGKAEKINKILLKDINELSIYINDIIKLHDIKTKLLIEAI